MSSIPKLLKLKDYVTLCGTTCGLLALMCACMGDRFWLSLGFFLVTITLGTDLLDGWVARKTGTVNEIGKELDSLSDSLTFGIAPAVLMFQAYKTGTGYDVLLVIGCIAYAFGAILRLARFNISEGGGYTGVPTPLSALMVIVLFYFNYFYAYALGGPGNAGLSEPFPAFSYYAIPFILICIGWFNITTHISFGEKGKSVYIFVIIITPLAPILGIIGMMQPGASVSMFISIFFLGGFIVILVYICLGFFKESKKE